MEITPQQLAEYELRATMAERERCAKTAEAMADDAAASSPWHGHQLILREVAKRIRNH